MIYRLGKSLPASCLLACSTALAQAPCDACAWSDRGDRWEGIYDQQVVNAEFRVMSVHYQHPSEGVAGSEDLHLVFWLPSQAVLETVRVWQPERLYIMEPGNKKYGAGRQSFAWPRSEVIDRLGLAISSLYTQVEAEDVYYPAILSAREDPVPAGGYEFVFQSGAGIDAMCSVRDASANVVRRFECWEDFGGTVVFEWDGRDDQGRTVPEGVYALQLDGEMLAETLRPIDESVSFWHRGPVQ